MGAKTRSRKRRGSRGACTYCGKHHKGGPSGDSCMGRNVRAMVTVAHKPGEDRAKVVRTEGGRIAHHERRNERIARAVARQKTREQRSPQEQLDVLAKRGYTEGREVWRLQAAVKELSKAG